MTFNGHDDSTINIALGLLLLLSSLMLIVCLVIGFKLSEGLSLARLTPVRIRGTSYRHTSI